MAFKWIANIIFNRRCATISLKLHQPFFMKCMIFSFFFNLFFQSLFFWLSFSYRDYAAFAFDFTNSTCSDWALGSFTNVVPSPKCVCFFFLRAICWRIDDCVQRLYAAVALAILHWIGLLSNSTTGFQKKKLKYKKFDFNFFFFWTYRAILWLVIYILILLHLHLHLPLTFLLKSDLHWLRLIIIFKFVNDCLALPLLERPTSTRSMQRQFNRRSLARRLICPSCVRVATVAPATLLAQMWSSATAPTIRGARFQWPLHLVQLCHRFLFLARQEKEENNLFFKKNRIIDFFFLGTLRKLVSSGARRHACTRAWVCFGMIFVLHFF